MAVIVTVPETSESRRGITNGSNSNGGTALIKRKTPEGIPDRHK